MFGLSTWMSECRCRGNEYTTRVEESKKRNKERKKDREREREEVRPCCGECECEFFGCNQHSFKHRRTSGVWKDRPNCARRSSHAIKSTFIAPGGAGAGGTGGGTGAGGGTHSQYGSRHHQVCSESTQLIRVHGGAAEPLSGVLAARTPTSLPIWTAFPSGPMVPVKHRLGPRHTPNVEEPSVWLTTMLVESITPA